MTNQRGYDLETLAAAKIYSNVRHDEFVVEYGVSTDGGCAEMLQEDGNRVEVVPGTSYEYVGNKTSDKSPSKIILAKNGNIHLEAQNGDIILKARNIRIIAEDGSGEVTITSGKTVEIRAPNIKVSGTNVTTTAPGNLGTFSGTKSGNVQIQNDDGSATDLLSGSFLGGIFSGLQSLKKFFNDCLGS